MAVKYSYGLRNFINNFGSFKQAMEGGEFIIYQGSVPTDPDGAISGTILVRCNGSGTASNSVTKETPARGTVTITVDGTVTGITVNSIQIMSGTVLAQGSVTDTAAAVAANINAFQTSLRVRAWNAAGVIYLEALPKAGNVTWAVVSAGTATRTDANFGSGGAARAYITGANGVTMGASGAGAIAKAGVWSGVNANTGNANFWVWYGNKIDDSGSADASPYHAYRIIGTCGTSGADYIMASTSLTKDLTHTVDLANITFKQTGS